MSKLTEIIKDLEKKYGAGTVFKIDDDKKIDIEVIPTGSISLDYALGIGGIPRGRIVEVFGEASTGKTTLALGIVAQAQKMGLSCAFVDAEHALDPEYAKKIGVDLKKVFISQPNSGDQALDIVEGFVKSGEIGLIIVDSVAALTPQAEIDGVMGQHHIGLQARLMSQALRKLTAITSQAKTTILFINQTRVNIGMTWGDKTTTSGGNALKFYTSIRLNVKCAAKLKNGEDFIGNRVIIKVAKNKLASPFKTADFDILFNEGISIESDVINFGLKHEILKKTGNTIYYNELKLGKSMEIARIYLKEHKEVVSVIIKDIKKKLK